ncbi:MAG: DEAD/DEAH box helicase [Hyphomicrobiales bacterium]|nr:DEAD/DEAH box helicase [Hyphomicrobiales bacterium]
MTSFPELGVADPLLRALKSSGYTQPTPIQQRAIPLLLDGRDLLGIAQTGTGKTAAFTLPILQRLSEPSSKRHGRGPSALILAPTRELAVQIAASLRGYGKHLNLRESVIYGGVSQGPQVKALQRGIDILVATPGRLLDLIEQGHARLDAVSIVVLDEADRMLDMGFVRDVRKILATVPKDRQSMLFSATMPKEIAGLAADILKSPVRVEVAPTGTAVELVDQRVFHVAAHDKLALLGTLMHDPAMSRVIVFTRTKHRANKVAQQLARSGISAAAIHGNKSQSARQAALDQFRTGRTRVLVATDIAARGIDVHAVTHIINFELPNEPETYVHRIGRTARAGASGSAVSFCDASERAHLGDIQKLIRRTIPVADVPTDTASLSLHPVVREQVHKPAPAAGKRGGPELKQAARKRRRSGSRNRPRQAAA